MLGSESGSVRLLSVIRLCDESEEESVKPKISVKERIHMTEYI